MSEVTASPKRNESLEKYAAMLDKFKKKKAQPAKTVHIVNPLNLPKDDIKSLLVQNRCRFRGFNNEHTNEFRISDPEKLTNAHPKSHRRDHSIKIKEITCQMLDKVWFKNFKNWLWLRKQQFNLIPSWEISKIIHLN